MANSVQFECSVRTDRILLCAGQDSSPAQGVAMHGLCRWLYLSTCEARGT